MSGMCEGSDIMRKVNIFVNSLSIDAVEDDLSVMQFSQCLAIVPKSERVFMEYNGWREYEIANISADVGEAMVEAAMSDDDDDDDMEFPESPGFLDQLEIKEEDFPQRGLPENESQFSILEDIFGGVGDQNVPSTPPKKGPHQKIDGWLKEMLMKSKNVTWVGTEMTTVFTCCICQKIQCATYTGMKVHIAKYHSAEKDSNGRESAQKIALLTGTSNNESLQQKLVEGGTSDHQWIESMVVKSKENEEEWRCGVCHIFLSKKPRGIKIHIRRNHCESNNYKAKTRQEPNDLEALSTSPNRINETCNTTDHAESERHDYDLNWISEKIEESRVRSEFGIWKCCICEKYKGQTVLGMKIHIAKSHCKSKVQETQDNSTPKTDRFDRNPSVVEGLLQASRTSFAQWKCSVCLNFSTTTEKGMKIHILRMHCNRNSFFMEKPSTSETSPSNTPEKSNSEINGEKHQWDSDWIQKIANQSRAGCETWICSICLRMQCKSLHGIKVHIAKAHCLPKLIDFNIPNDEKRNSIVPVNKVSCTQKKDMKKNMWLKRKIDESEITAETENGARKRWICSICKNFQGDSMQGIRLHIIKRHLKGQNASAMNGIKKLQSLPRQMPGDSPNKQYHQKTSDLTDKERNWLSDQMNKSREIIENQNAWKCRMCNKTFTVYTSMRYHLTSKHMKHMVGKLIVNDGASTSHGIK